jgi:excisionase family DNA binding protein
VRIELDPEIRPTLSVDEACVVLGISRSSGYAGAKTGELPVIQIGRRLRVPTAALIRMLELDEVKAS